MSGIEIQDSAWQAIMADDRLSSVRRKLSFHELRLIIDHVRRVNPLVSVVDGLTDELEKCRAGLREQSHALKATYEELGRVKQTAEALGLHAMAATVSAALKLARDGQGVSLKTHVKRGPSDGR